MRRLSQSTLLLSCLLAVSTGSAESDIVLPERPRGVHFDHAAHIRRNGEDCSRCHSDALDSRKASDLLLPRMSPCTKCHEEAPSKSGGKLPSGNACMQCHLRAKVAPPGPLASAPPRIHFNHAEHLERGTQCTLCHKILGERMGMPEMSTCLECHGGSTAPGQCYTCHETLEDGRIKVRFHEGELVPGPKTGVLYHGPRWTTGHARAARLRPGDCKACHGEWHCTSCHSGVSKPIAIHPADWDTLHAVAARNGSMECSACHRNEGSCKACHDRLGATKASPYKGSNFRIHPSGWADAGTSVPGHAREAARNPGTCISCHTEADCIACHGSRSAGFGGMKPHGHLSKRELQRRYRLNSRPCLACHPEGPPGGIVP